MRENVMEWYSGDDRVTVTLWNGKHKNKVLKLAKQYPDEVEIVAENKDGSICAHVPLRYIRITRPVEISAEERERRSVIGKNNAKNLIWHKDSKSSE